jgi:LDH2 family malate/lactate/ureidoglycolate dehydrogenase
LITHRNVNQYVDALRSVLGITAGDRYLHTASFSFSSAMRQFLLPLSSGAAVVMASSDELHDPHALLQTMQREQVTVTDLVPSYWRQLQKTLAAFDPDKRRRLLDNDLRLILSASEPLSSDLPEGWRTLGHSARIVNMYGQTETTGIVSTYEVPTQFTGESRAVPVGLPIPGTMLQVVDVGGRPLPIGMVGELCVEGAGVGAGYLDRPVETATRFALGSSGGSPRYMTGDQARMRADGAIELLGRRDQQLKLRGFRIEPGEVEAAVLAHPRVAACAVELRRDPTGSERLVAFIVATASVRDRSGASLVSSIRTLLKERLPAFMVPAVFVELPALPLTTTGKVDRSRLSALELPSARSADAFVAPGRPAEQWLAESWARLLGLERVGADDNFFDLGGDSLLGLQMIDEATRAGLRLTPRQLFQFQTIGELARAAERAEPERPRGVEADATERSAQVSSRVVARITLDSARAFCEEALTRAGLSPRDAALMADVQIEASLRGQPTHNIGAIPRYGRRLSSGATNARPQFRVSHDTATSAVIDADNGPGQLVALAAMDLAMRKATDHGIGIIGVKGSNHFGAAGHYVWQAATRNLIGLCTTNSALWLAPSGGLTPLFGTNPLGVGVPAGRHHPIVLDVSMSVTAKGKVALQLAQGQPLSPGWILDRSGRASVDPADLVAGLGVPIGGHKGYGLALVMEILAGVLTGAGFGLDHRRDRLKQPRVQADYGHFFMAIDPGLFMTREEFASRVDRLIDEVKLARRVEGVAEILLPGEAEMRARDANLRAGIPLSASVQRALLKYRDDAGLTSELVTVDPLVEV